MPQFNFQPIYNKYAGNTLDLEDKLLSKKEEEYRVGEQYMDTYDKLRKSMQAAPISTDIEAVNNLSKSAIDDIKQFTEKGDYENLYNKIKGSVVDLQAKYAPYAQNMKSYYEQVKNIMDKKDWSPEFKKQLINIRKKQYENTGGLQIDPSTGLATNYVNLGDIADYHNVQEKLMDFANKITIDKNYEDSFIKGGLKADGVTYELYDKKTGKRTETRDANKIIEIGQQYLLNSPELLGTLKQQSEVEAYSMNDPIKYLNNYNKNIDNRIKELKSYIGKTHNDEKIQNEIYKLENQKVTSIENPEETVKNILLNSKINNDTYNVANALKVNNKEIHTDYSHGFYWELAQSKDKKKIADAEGLYLASKNEPYSAESFKTMYKTINSNYTENLNKYNSTITPFLKGFKQVYGDKFDANKFNEVINSLNTKGYSEGFSLSNYKEIAEIFNSKGFNTVTPKYIEKNANLLLSAVRQKSLADDANYEKQKLDGYVKNIIPKNTINELQKEIEKKHGIKLSDSELKDLIVDVNINGVNNIYDSPKTSSYFRSMQGVSNLLFGSVRKTIDKKTEGKIDFKNYQQQYNSFSNTTEGSTVYEANKQLTKALSGQSVTNFTSNGVPFTVLLKNGVTPIGSTETIKPEAGDFELKDAKLADGNKVEATFETKDKQKFTVLLDGNNDNGNLKTFLKDNYIKIANSNASEQEKVGATVALADNLVPRKTWVDIMRLPLGESINFSANGNDYKVTKNYSNGLYKLTNANGQPIYVNPKSPNDAKTDFQSIDDIKYQIGWINR